DRCDPHRDGEARLAAHLAPEPRAHLRRRSEQPLAAGEIEERLVEREAFERGREAGEDAEDTARLARVLHHVARPEDALGGQPPGATAVGIAEGPPTRRASWLAADTTPRPPVPPTTTGLPRSAGRSRCSTAA